MSKKSNKNLFEFLRYAIVGGIAALVDMGVLALFKEVVFGGSEKVSALIIATTAGFFAGLAVNFILSRIFVFTSAEQHKRDGGWKGFLLYTLGVLVLDVELFFARFEVVGLSIQLFFALGQPALHAPHFIAAVADFLVQLAL